jgi:hypothetical protein
MLALSHLPPAGAVCHVESSSSINGSPPSPLSPPRHLPTRPRQGLSARPLLCFPRTGSHSSPRKTTSVHPQPWPTSVASLPALLLPWLPSSPLPATVHAVPRRLELGTTPSQGRGPPFPAMEPKPISSLLFTC